MLSKTTSGSTSEEVTAATLSFNPTSYSRLVPKRLQHYYIGYWAFLGVVLFVIYEVAISVSHERRFTVTAICLSLLVAFTPSFFIWFDRQFMSSIAGLFSYLWRDDSDYCKWASGAHDSIFTLRSWLARVMASLVFASGIASISTLDWPFRGLAIRSLAILVFAIVLGIMAQTAYSLVVLSVYVRKLSRLESRFEFFLAPHPAISRLFRVLMAVSLAVVVAYAVIFFAIFRGPFGTHGAMLVWLTWLALYPVGLFLWWVLQVHTMLLQNKNRQVEQVNDEVLEAMDVLKKRRSGWAIDELDRLMTLQERVQAMKEWPVGLRSTGPILVALAPLVAQGFLLQRFGQL